MIFGEPLLRHDVVGSTQDIAHDLALGGAVAGTVVTANFQTHGRGRRGHTWYAPPGANVCLTAVAPPVPGPDAWQVALVAGLAVAEGVAETAGVRTHVRFPNDVLVGGAKVAGVLVETVPERDGRVVPLIGLGVNVNIAEFPPEVRAIATSLERVSGVRRDVVSVEQAVLRRLGLCWDEWIYGGLAATLERWKPLHDPAARRTFVLDDTPVSCRVLDLATDGTLSVETPQNVLHRLPAAAIVLGEE